MNRRVILLFSVAVAWVGGAAAEGVTVSFGGAASDAAESLATPVIAVKLSEAATATVTVRYTVTGGTAARGETAQPPADYVLADGTLTFAPGTVNGLVPIEVVDDALVEPPETVLLALSEPGHAALGAQIHHTFTIRDDDAIVTPVVEFSAASSAGSETVGTAKLAVVAYPPTDGPITVGYSVTGGSAQPGKDYTLAQGSLAFAARETAKVISMAVSDDTEVEQSKTVVVTLSGAQGAVVGYKESHTFTILDNDEPPEVRVSFQAAQSAVQEDVGIHRVPVVVTVTGGPRTEDVTVAYAASGGSAQGGGVDYTLASGSLTFAPNQAQATVSIQVVDDDRVERAETLGIALSNPVGAKLGTYANHELTVRDNDVPVVHFVEATTRTDEGDGPTAVGIALSQASPDPVLVDYTLGGTATQGDDYALAIGTVNIPAGETTAVLVPDILDDMEDEDSETVVLTLDSPVNARLGAPEVHTLTIEDDDAEDKPTLRFEKASSMVDEFAAPLGIDVLLSHALETDVTVPLDITGTAASGEDYTLTSGSVTFPAGTIRAHVTGTIVDDKVDESDETIVVELQSPAGVKPGEPTLHTCTILDNDYAASELSLFKQETLSVDGKTFTVLGPRALTVDPRGLAVDAAGNYYISDWGPHSGGDGEGGILFWPKGRAAVVRIVSGLTKPGDVELSPDQRSLIVAGPGGTVERRTLGLSVRLRKIDPFEGGIVVHVFGAGPEKVATVSPDGLFHVPGLLDGEEPKSTVDITVERRGSSKTFTAVPLGQSDGTYGHRIAELDF